MTDEILYGTTPGDLTKDQLIKEAEYGEQLLQAAVNAGIDTDGLTAEQLQDMLRTAGRRASPQVLNDYLKSFGLDRDLTLFDEPGPWTHGEYIGTLKLPGRELAVTVHSVATAPFAILDVGLEKAKKLAIDADEQTLDTDGAFVLAAHPQFRFTHTANGDVLRMVVQAGWILTDDGWRDVCHSPQGAADFTADHQLKFFKSGEISRGFFRDRGFSAQDVMQELAILAAGLDVLSADNAEMNEIIGLSSEELSNPRNYSFATGPEGWTRMMNGKVMDIMQDAMGKL